MHEVSQLGLPKWWPIC